MRGPYQRKPGRGGLDDGQEKSDQQASPKKMPLDDTCSHSQRLITRPEADRPCATFREGMGFLPCGTQPEKE